MVLTVDVKLKVTVLQLSVFGGDMEDKPMERKYEAVQGQQTGVGQNGVTTEVGERHPVMDLRTHVSQVLKKEVNRGKLRQRTLMDN